jgi:hypothetical protein
MVNKLTNLNGPWRWLMVLVAPLLALGVDFYFFPLAFSLKIVHKEVSLNEILADQQYLLGTFRAHHILVSVDDIQDTEYLPFIGGGPNALVISAFASGDRRQTAVEGMLQRAVSSRLKILSP